MYCLSTTKKHAVKNEVFIAHKSVLTDTIWCAFACNAHISYRCLYMLHHNTTLHQQAFLSLNCGCFQQNLLSIYKGGFRGGARGAEAPPPPPLQVYSTPVQNFAGTGKSCSSVNLDNLLEMVTVEEERMEARVVTKRLGDGP